MGLGIETCLWIHPIRPCSIGMSYRFVSIRIGCGRMKARNSPDRRRQDGGRVGSRHQRGSSRRRRIVRRSFGSKRVGFGSAEVRPDIGCTQYDRDALQLGVTGCGGSSEPGGYVDKKRVGKGNFAAAEAG